MQVTSQRASAILYNYLSGNHLINRSYCRQCVSCSAPVVYESRCRFEFIDIDESHAMSTEKCLTAIEAGKYSGLVFVHAYGKSMTTKNFTGQ